VRTSDNGIQWQSSESRVDTSSSCVQVLVCGDLNVAHLDIDFHNPQASRSHQTVTRQWAKLTHRTRRRAFKRVRHRKSVRQWELCCHKDTRTCFERNIRTAPVFIASGAHVRVLGRPIKECASTISCSRGLKLPFCLRPHSNQSIAFLSWTCVNRSATIVLWCVCCRVIDK
jgi:hypothetical protein